MHTITSADDWKYFAEGGKHVLFVCTSQQHPHFAGKLLRIAKGTHQATVTSQQYIQQCILPTIGAEYLDTPTMVRIDPDCLSQLQRHAIEHTTRDKDKIVLQQDHAWLWTNYRRNMTIELKPKAGYLAFAPFVQYPIKYKASRFALLQRLCQQNHLVKGWQSCADFEVSQYDPIATFRDASCDLQGLFRTPQNNLRIWPSSSCNGNAEQLLSQILKKEHGLLQRILRLQKLDIIDADGAVLLYDELVQRHCNGDRIRAEQLIDDLNPHGDNDHAAVTSIPLLQHSPFPLPTQHETIRMYCQLIDEPSASQDQAMALIPQFTQDEIVYLLQNWLLSLTMCDVSILMSIRDADDYDIVVMDCDPKPASKLRTRGQREALFGLLEADG